MRLRPIFARLFLPSLLLFGLVSPAVDEWIWELAFPVRSIAGIFETSPAGLRYNRGFPRGIWGTNLAPDLGRYDETNQSFLTDGFFWNRARSWLTLEEHWVDPQKAYDVFRANVLNYMCDNDTWICCTAGIMDVTCGSPPPSMQELVYLLMDPTQNMPVLFLYWWCTQAWVNFHEQMKGPFTATLRELKHYLMQYCPSPCMAKPCRHIPGVEIPNACNTVGPFEDDFECICKKNSVWDQSTQSCKPINPCFPQGYMPCSKEGTIACVALNMQTPLCICKPEYTGKDCGQLRNACLSRFNKTDANGNTNCGIIQGNLCNPILGTDFYKCLCGMGWISSPTLAYDNCDVLNDPCNDMAIEEVGGTNPVNVSAVNEKGGPRIGATIDCQNGGFCSSSPDNSMAACLCPSTASGTYCEIPRGMWSGWTKYSDCRNKNCGISRYKWRRRQCLNDTVEIEDPDASPEENSINCFGISEELRNCEEALPCETFRLSGYYRREIFHFPTLHTFLIFLLIELVCTYLLYKTCGFWLVSSILRRLESSKTKTATEHTSGKKKAVTFVCEEISQVEAQDILTRTPTPELFIEGRVDARSDSPEPLDDEQYLALIRQRIIQRILELVEKKQKEKVQFYRELIWSKTRRLWNSSKSTLLRWADSSLHWLITYVRTFRAVIRTETSRPPNGKTGKLTGDRKGRITETLTRQLAKISIERKDHQEGGERKTFTNIKEGTAHAAKALADKVEEKTLSMVNLLGSFLPKSPSKSREDTAVVKDTSFTSDNMNNPEHVVEEEIMEEKKRAALTDQKHVLTKRPERKSRRKAYISDTLDQISSSEFDTDTDDNDDNDRTLTQDPVPKSRLKRSNPEESAMSFRPFISELRQSYEKQGKASERAPKRVEFKKETHLPKRIPSRIDLNRPSGTFRINAAQRSTSTVREHNLPKIPEDKTTTDDMYGPVPVTSTNRRMRKTTSAGGLPYSGHQFGRNMEARESDGPSNLPPHPIRTTSYPQMRHPPAVVEVSLEDEDEAGYSRKYSKEKFNEKQTQK